MSKYGLKIKNIQAGSLYDVNLGVRDRLDCKDAMFTNSLLKDFLMENGLNVWKEESTRDIICLEFDYGSRSCKEEVDFLQKSKDKFRDAMADEEDAGKIEDIQKHMDYLDTLIRKAEGNHEKFCKKSAADIRIEYYVNGVPVTYYTHDRKGNIIDTETIHYRMLFRTPGKAKKGACMFIRDSLYDAARDFLQMGLEMPYENAPIIEMGAYSSLITSTIIDRIRIEPENILILPDIDVLFNTKVISVETDKDRHCRAVPLDDYRVKNTLFDGQALIDSGIFPEWGNGYILLRHHFCKMAAFESHIQQFFRDQFGDDYETATVTDMFGVTHFVKDIKVITTDNAMKWLKFDVSYEYWCKKVWENGAMFGIVKTAHKSKLGEVQRMSYQMVNSLDIDLIEDVMEETRNYVHLIKSDDQAFIEYLKDNGNFSNDYEVLVALIEHNPEFVRSDYFRERKQAIIKTYVKNARSGRIIQNADNLVVVGSPYAMLLYAAGLNPIKDDTFFAEDGCIQCYTERFSSGEYLAGFRSPFNSRNNMTYLHNVYHSRLEKYFEFGPQIVAVNMIGTDFQDRNNGSDQDSDSLYITNAPAIVDCARRFYSEYPTIVNNIPMEKNRYANTLENFAIIDNNLAAAQRVIGESSNLAQIGLTYTYNFADSKYHDYVCILSVLAQVAIDNAKRRYDLDLVDEIKRIKKDMDVANNGLPAFWKVVNGGINAKRINSDLKCPMNSLYNYKFAEFKPKTTTLPIKDFFINHKMEDQKTRRQSKKVEQLIQTFSLELFNGYQSFLSDESADRQDGFQAFILYEEKFEWLISEIRATYISKSYAALMSWLINRAFCISSGMKRNKNKLQTKLNNNRSLLLKTLYSTNKEVFLSCFKKDL